MDAPGQSNTHLTWTNVAIGGTFIVFDAVVSLVFGLGVGSSLVTAAIRCVLQLSVMALLLGSIFSTGSPWAVAGIAFLNKSKRRYTYMFPSVLVAMACSTIPVSLLGSRFAMSIEPFWKPDQYIPIIGMLCGSTISGIVVAVSSVLRELHENRDKVETYLAFGASRLEACRPIAQEALRLALLPTVNQMSVIGLISIPGMMTGALLGGSPVEQAAKLQMVIMFMISACTALAAITASVLTLVVVVDNEHRIRGDRMSGDKHVIWKTRDAFLGRIGDFFQGVWHKLIDAFKRRKVEDDRAAEGERRPLLG
ncbi:UPF0014-domain-containing protein [Sistotremastrum niveocremeum HHB9708]|uniref:UPF0014-domain-containing protein n=2 Tax=Sistotremastraceae TaxID=3402574 RepID=A0A164TPA8_9AGAM|nr:UPF0014-domain-containing protein [Sistotremastrum niveocremeum HHB9708]KZT42194.1 UPF0014-domain-containing protein [Sistotremastrum suecicum HHB10207 ss-3]